MRENASKYVWILTLAFLLAAAFLSARLAATWLARRLWVPAVETEVAVTAGDAVVRGDRLSDYRVIQERNLFNANPSPEPTALTTDKSSTQQPVPVVSDRTPLDVVLVGTAVLEGARSFAVVESGGKLRVVRENEELAPGAVVSAIKADRILVDRGGAVQEILLFVDRPGGKKKPGRRATARPRPAAADSDTIRKVADDKWVIDAREVEKATTDMNRLMTQIRVVPNFKDGQADGFKVFAIRPGSLFSKIGLRNGDVIKRINGLELQGPEEAFEAYQRLKDETSIQIDLVRRNQNKSFTYEIR